MELAHHDDYTMCYGMWMFRADTYYKDWDMAI